MEITISTNITVVCPHCGINMLFNSLYYDTIAKEIQADVYCPGCGKIK